MDGIVRRIIGREILDSRGNPTVEAEVITDDGVFRGSVPSGASTGSFEAVEKRDGGDRYRGKGVLQAVSAVNSQIAEALQGKSVVDQRGVDRTLVELDGTENKRNLGANALLAVSIAAARAGAKAHDKPLFLYLAQLAESKGVTLPIPQMNVINGGRHAGIDDDIQEHMIMPLGASSFREALRISCEVYSCLRDVIKEEVGVQGTHLGDEGGFVPKLDQVEKRLDLIVRAVDMAGYSEGVALALDCAASEFYRSGKYHIREQVLDRSDLVDFYQKLVDEYPIVSIEDGMHEEDWEGWAMLTERLGHRIQIVGDDLLVTNVERMRRGMRERSVNAMILKANQIGTVTESIEAAQLARDNNWEVVVSHRSGETEDTFISDLAVGVDASQSKFGAPARTDRTAKYNELLRIEEFLGERAVYASFPFAPARARQATREVPHAGRQHAD